MKKIMLIFFMIIFNNFYIFANENLDINDTNKNIFEEHKPKKEIEKKFIDDKNIEFKDHILPDISINKLKENLTDKNETIIDTNKKIDILSLENKKLSKEEKAKIEYIRNKNLEIKKLQLKINEISRKIEYIQNITEKLINIINKEQDKIQIIDNINKNVITYDDILKNIDKNKIKNKNLSEIIKK